MTKRTAQIGYDVYQPDGRGDLKKIDTVFASYDDPEEMRRSLISHDGYSSDIVVTCGGKVSPQNAELPDDVG